VAEIDDKGAVSVEGHAVGRLEGFRFRMDAASNPDEARTMRQAAAQALAPQFHLRADRFYNAPDTEIDFTEQGGLMWGEHAVGRLAKGPEALRPEVVAFVDEEAGPDVAQKVQRRLQHFIDRRIAATQEPLLALQRDETLTGVAKGFAYRLVENFGIIPRSEVAEEVKALDPEARSALRKHGIRLGQFTVFLPALLKPAPTRLRLVLWSLWKALDEFPSAPPPGHVTVPAPHGAPQGFWAMAGYRAAGARAIRIDMLERLADLLRDKDSRAGFEAQPDMLSITGLSLETFAHLMEGLGYRAERGERPKVRAPKPAPVSASVPDPAPPVEEPPSGPDVAPPQAPTEDPAPQPEAPPGEPAEVPTQPDLPDPGGPDETPPDIPQELPVEDPQEAPDTGPMELPGEAPSDIPDITPVEMPADMPMEMPFDSPMEMPSSPYAQAAEPVEAEPMAAEPVAAEPVALEAPAQPAELEVFYTFTWAGRAQRRGGQDQQRRGEGRGPRREARGESRGERPQGDRRGPRPDRATPAAPPGEVAPAAEAQQPRRENRDRGERRFEGKPRGDRPERGERPERQDRGPRPDRSRPQQFEARPAREDSKPKRIDPDNPFAAALAGFKPK
jgi:ATP-dependent RNA helicase SUPV3L1/SUV3